MSKNGSKKELILTLSQKKYPRSIEEIVGHSIDKIKIEISKGAKKIDFYAVNEKKRVEIFVENQIKGSDRTDHLQQKITPLIQNISDGYVIWTAAKFRQDHIDEVKQLLRQNPQKYINFYAAEIHPEVIRQINDLNTLYELDIWENLHFINEVDEKFKVIDSHVQMPATHIGNAFLGEPANPFIRDDDIKEYLLNELRNKIPYFLNFHSEKKHLEFDKILKVGAGLADITYFSSALDTRDRGFVEIRFGYSKSSWYRYFKKMEDYLKELIHRDIYFNDQLQGIGYSIRSDRKHIPNVVNELVDVFEKFILFFSKYTYGKFHIVE